MLPDSSHYATVLHEHSHRHGHLSAVDQVVEDDRGPEVTAEVAQKALGDNFGVEQDAVDAIKQVSQRDKKSSVKNMVWQKISKKKGLSQRNPNR